MALALFLPLLLAPAVADGDCSFMRVNAAAGAIVSESDATRGPCGTQSVSAKLRYDARRGVAVARVALTEGESIGRVYLPARPSVLPGDTVQLTANIGHVVIRREMRALQPARLNQRFFAQDSEGQIIRAPRLTELTSNEH